MKVLILIAASISLTYAQNSDTACAKEVNGKLVAVPNEPNKFYHCDNCIGILKCCPSGLIFSSASQACVWPDTGCGGSENCGSTPPSITGSTAPTNPTVTATATAPVTNPTAPPPITGSPTTDCPDLCPNGVYRPFPNDSSKYIVCSGGVDYTMCCPSGLIWNNTLKTCARKDAGCGGVCS